MKNAFYTVALAGFLILGGEAAVYSQSKGKAKPKATPAKVTTIPAKVTDPVAPKCGPNGLTAAETTEILNAHNNARAELKLPLLSWDCTMANMAQEWAARGVFEHRETTYGENMFVSSQAAEHIASVVNKWMGEKANWTNSTGTCAAGKFCNHYTQIVWKTTTHVGCGINRNATGKWKALLVCNYNPGGNMPGPAY